MSSYFIYYTESNIVCLLIFAIMLIHDLRSMDRQEKQIKYDKALVAFMCYFISDCVWAAVDSGVLPKTAFSVLATHFSNYVIMCMVTYSWLNYVMAMEEVPHRDRRINKFAVIFPFLVSTAVMILVFLISPRTLIGEDLKMKPLFDVFLLAVPYVYIIAVIVYAVRRLRTEENPEEKRKHLFIGFFPLMVIACGLVELLFMPTTPIYCYGCTILMIMLYIQALDRRISTDPLTRLNNRGQLVRYVSQKNNLHMEGRRTFVMMLDVNDFKSINDTFGHAEGDRALRLVASALRTVAQASSCPIFLGRYGGDEFIMVVHAAEESTVGELAEQIRGELAEVCADEELAYKLSVGIGYDELRALPDNFQQCQQRADHRLYLDKQELKLAEAEPPGRPRRK